MRKHKYKYTYDYEYNEDYFKIRITEIGNKFFFCKRSICGSIYNRSCQGTWC